MGNKDVNMDELKTYITKVCRIACIAEHRRIFVNVQYAIIGDKLLIAIHTQYDKVYRRICRRLRANLYKNFGLFYCNVDPNEQSDINVEFLPNMIDTNYSFALWDVFGTCGSLRSADPELNPHLTGDHAIRCNALLDGGMPREYIAPYAVGKRLEDIWGDISKYYEKVFGELPIEINNTVRFTVEE